MRTISFAEAMNEALQEEMRRDPSVYLMGLGLHLSSKGPGLTSGLLEEFGGQRVRSIPISEPAVAGSCVGAALAGMRPVAYFSLADFVICALDEILCKAGDWAQLNKVYAHHWQMAGPEGAIITEVANCHCNGSVRHQDKAINDHFLGK